MRGLSKPLPGTPLDWAHPLTRGLYAAWHFREGGGSVVHNDTLRSGLDGTIVDPSLITWAGCRSGTGLVSAATASTSKITLANFGTFGLGVPWSWDAWIRPDGGGDNFGMLFGRASGDGIFLRSAGTLDFFTTSSQQTTGVIAAGEWAHAAITDTGAGGSCVSLYLRGLLDRVASSYSWVPSAMFNDSVSETFLGRCEYQRFWNRALSALEIRQLQMDPYGMFAQPSTRKYFFRTAGVLLNPDLSGGFRANLNGGLR